MKASAPVLKVKASSPAATGWKASKYVIVNGFLLLCAIAGFYLLILKKDVVIVGDTGISEQMVLTTSTIHKTNDSSSHITDSNDNKESNDNNNDNENKDAISEGCKIQCEQKEKEKNDRMDHFNGYDLLNSNDLLQTVQKEKQKYLDKLKILYGPENYENMFYETVDGKKISRGRIIFQSPNGLENTTSWERFTRKLIIKILSVQKKIIQQGEQQDDGGKPCDCSSIASDGRKNTLRRGTAAGLDELPQQEEPQQRNRRKAQNNNGKENYKYEKYVFANGGHSAAAAHGNLYDESYTSFLEQNLHDIFQSIGIEFEGRQYAMGGTQSGGEVALCTESLYGIDVDTLNWDFGMMDGNDLMLQLLYLYDTGLTGIFEQQPLSIRSDNFYSGMPTSITFNVHGDAGSGRNQILTHMENNCGMSTLVFDSKTKQKVMDAIPDTLGKTDEEILNMPLNVRYFKCNNQIETGEPYCGDKKYNDTICPNRQYKAGWHPGWKVHSLHGQFLSLLFVEALEDAVNFLKDHNAGITTKTKIQELYNQLNEQNVKDQNLLLESSVPMDVAKRILKTQENPRPENLLENNKYYYEDLITMVYKSHSFCHIASLPSDIRYRGILTEQHQFENLDGSSSSSSSSLQLSPMTKQQQQFSLYHSGDFNENSGKYFYDIGFGRGEMNKILEQLSSTDDEQQADSIIRLVYDESARQQCVNATYLNVDYKDYFFIHHKSKWSTISLPNDEEIKYYNIHTPTNSNDHNNRLKGLILFCGVKCDWNVCPEGEIGIGGLVANNANNELASVEVNGQPVKEYLDFGSCTLLMKERAVDSTSDSRNSFFSSHYIWLPDPDTGKYNFRIKVNKPDSYFRMSSIVIL